MENRGASPVSEHELRVESLELGRRRDVVQRAAKKRSIVLFILISVILLFCVRGYFGVATATLASEAGSPPSGVWPLFFGSIGAWRKAASDCSSGLPFASRVVSI